MIKLLNGLCLLTILFLSACNDEAPLIEAPQVYCRIQKFADNRFFYGQDGFVNSFSKFNSDRANFIYTGGKLTEIDLGIYGNEKFFYNGDTLKRIEVTDRYREPIYIDVTVNELNQIVKMRGLGALDYLTNKPYTTTITYHPNGGVADVITFNEVDSIYTYIKYDQYDLKDNPIDYLPGWPINVLNDNSQYIFFKFPFKGEAGSPTRISTLTDTLTVINTLADTNAFWVNQKYDYEYAGAGFQVSCIDSASKQIIYECRYEDCPK
ncbi:MAG: hypothetical protein WAT92_17785 [Saprospiraceae bacterium]|nr:hypothetical protein [Saprospiraceae bacterium]